MNKGIFNIQLIYLTEIHGNITLLFILLDIIMFFQNSYL